jgi:hypothetical protein
MSSDGYAARLERMLILAVAAFDDNKAPSSSFDYPNRVTDFHDGIIPRESGIFNGRRGP